MDLPPLSRMRLVTAIAAAVTWLLGTPLTHSAPGEPDRFFDVSPSGGVQSMAVQADGKIIVGGDFTVIAGVARTRLARLNPDGTADPDFNPSPGATITALAVQPDGKILIGGRFNSIAGQQRSYLARLNADGTLDAAFNPQVNYSVFGIRLQPDGAIVINGIFTFVGAVERDYLARLHPDGTLDAGFDAALSDDILSAALQSDGRWVIAGNFTTVGGQVRASIARLNHDGTVDSEFNAAVDSVTSLALQADGKILIGGAFSTVGGQPRSKFARLNADGSLDASFHPDPTGGIYFYIDGVDSSAVQADGRIVIVGNFQTVAGVTRHYIARLNADGSLDSQFNPDADYYGTGALLQADGRLLVSGPFSKIGSVPRRYFARLYNDVATQRLSVTAADRVEWLRGGTAPEVTEVSFELSTDGGTTWDPLGAGSRIAGGWEATGLALPASGLLRARAQTSGGEFNGCSSLIQALTSFPDGATMPPQLVAPVSNSAVRGPILVDFTLPEAALPGSLRLTFTGPGTRTLTLAPSLETALSVTFSLDPGALNASSEVASIEGGSALPDGAYTVTLSYQDTAGNAAATSVATNFVVDNQSPTLDLRAVSLVADANGSAMMPDLSGIATDAGGVASFTQTPAKDTPMMAGTYVVSVSATDRAGNFAEGKCTLLITFPRPLVQNTASVATTGEAPQTVASFGVTAPTGAILDRFGPPAISDARVLVSKVVLRAGRRRLDAIYRITPAGDSALVALEGAEAPDWAPAHFTSFYDPVISPNGTIGFIAKIAGPGVRSDNNVGVWEATPDGRVSCRRRTNDSVSGRLKAILEISEQDYGEGVAGLGRISFRGRTARLLFTLDSSTAYGPGGNESVFAPALGSPGQGRWHSLNHFLTKIHAAGGQVGIYDPTMAPMLTFAETGDLAGFSDGSRWRDFGLPALDLEARHVVVRGVLDGKANRSARKKDTALGLSVDGAKALGFARAGDLAPGTGGAQWADFFDPVVDDSGNVAFLATLQGSAVDGGNRTGLWWGSPNAPILVARLGDETVPGPDGALVPGLHWTAFESFALPNGPGSAPVFIARFDGAGVSRGNRRALYAVDGGGHLRQLLRLQDSIEDRTVADFTVLNAVRGSLGVARSYNHTGSVALKVSFTDGTQSLVRIDLP